MNWWSIFFGLIAVAYAFTAGSCSQRGKTHRPDVYWFTGSALLVVVAGALR